MGPLRPCGELARQCKQPRHTSAAPPWCRWIVSRSHPNLLRPTLRPLSAKPWAVGDPTFGLRACLHAIRVLDSQPGQRTSIAKRAGLQYKLEPALVEPSSRLPQLKPNLAPGATSLLPGIVRAHPNFDRIQHTCCQHRLKISRVLSELG